MMHIHTLDGCAPAPLAHYLKALGILRIVAEQADAQARGWWEGERFKLATALDEAALLVFIRDEYKPVPIFNPWGGRSGFYADGSEKAARKALSQIEQSNQPRLAPYRTAIASVRSVLVAVTFGKKPKDKDKKRLVMTLRQQVRGPAASWLDAVVAVITDTDGEIGTAYPPIFGTGGNEGSGSYTSAYMVAVCECVVEPRWNHALTAALFRRAVPKCETDIAMGQFVPEGVSNPWDLMLAFEGACLLRSAVLAKSAGSRTRTLASPFAVRPATFGYASAARLDEYALKQGNELQGRGEQWFPLWNQPLLLPELMQVFAEGRSSQGKRVATDGWSMARAASSFGVRRGIAEFARYGYLQRNNLASHYAVPLGRFRVAETVSPQAQCLDDLDRWFDVLRAEARRKEASSRLRQNAAKLAEALFAVVQAPSQPARWQATLLALADVESVMRTGSGFKAQPIPALRPEWASAADDGSPEFRLALAFALQAAAFKRRDGKPEDPIRRHWLPLDPQRPGRFATSGDIAHTRLERHVDVVLQGREGVADAIALLERRLIEAASTGQRGFPLQPAPRAAAHPADLAAWLAGGVDTDRTLALARALMALHRGDWAEQIVPLSRPTSAPAWPDDAWLVLRLAHTSQPWPGGQTVHCDPAILRRLASGDAATAVTLALRRLRAAGLRCSVRAAVASPPVARLWAAALAFPIHPYTAQRFARRLDPTFAEEHFA